MLNVLTHYSWVILHRVPLIGFPNMAYHIPSWEIMGNHGKSWEILAMAGSAASAASTASPHPSIKESTKGGGRRRRPPPFVEAARSAASFMDGCGEAGLVPPSSASNTPVECLCRVPPSSAPSHNYQHPPVIIINTPLLGVSIIMTVLIIRGCPLL